jgi:hypothetical protein
MAEPTASNFPTTVDNDTSLGGDVVNLKSFVLASGIDASTTTITTTGISGINTPCYLLLDSELVYAESTSGADFTSCVRGAGGTTAAAHSSNITIDAVYAANSFNQLKRAIIATQTRVLKMQNVPDGTMFNGKISPAVVSSDLVLSLLTASGGTPSASDPVLVKINGTVRSVTAATTMTLADATNWFGLGGSAFAALEHDLFAYAVWDSNSSIVAISAARIPYGRLVSDFSATTTNEKHLGNYANFTSTDDVVNIGRFAATLSAAAGHVWTVPTYTNANLIQYPIFVTEWRTWAPTPTGFSAVPTNVANRYRLEHNTCTIICRAITPGTSNATTYTIPLPFTAKTVSNMVWQATGTGRNNSVDLTVAIRVAVSSAASVMDAFTDYLIGAWTAANTKILYQMTPLTYEI